MPSARFYDSLCLRRFWAAPHTASPVRATYEWSGLASIVDGALSYETSRRTGSHFRKNPNRKHLHDLGNHNVYEACVSFPGWISIKNQHKSIAGNFWEDALLQGVKTLRFQTVSKVLFWRIQWKPLTSKQKQKLEELPFERPLRQPTRTHNQYLWLWNMGVSGFQFY